jgi:radical SAM superfamily enzyme YgiQ (UPF0313 family)
MIGLPEETVDDMKKTVDTIIKIKEISPESVIVGPHVFRPYPGSELYEKVKRYFKQPETLREWGELGLVRGYTPAKKLGWVKNPAYIDNVIFYIQRAYSMEQPGGLRKTFEAPFKSMARYRLEKKIFAFPLDKLLFNVGQNMYMRSKKLRSTSKGVQPPSGVHDS